MDGPGMGLFFRNEMKDLLAGGAPEESVVRPLVIIMSIQDLESMEGSIATSEFYGAHDDGLSRQCDVETRLPGSSAACRVGAATAGAQVRNFASELGPTILERPRSRSQLAPFEARRQHTDAGRRK
jgi:hypothetical protein